MLRLWKKEIKTLKLVGGYQKVYLLLYVIKHIVIHVSLIVAWPEPKLWHGWSPNHYGRLWSNGPRHIGYRLKALVIARMINSLSAMDGCDRPLLN